MSKVESRSTTKHTDLTAGVWRLDPERSSVEFHVGHLWGLVTVKGRFDSYQGVLDLDAEPAISLTIDAGSMQTGNTKRDRHLRSADFFDAEQHPYVRFVSEAVTVESDSMKVRGRLHARGNSIPLEFEVPIRTTDDGVEIEALTSAAHRDLGMTFSPVRVIRPTSRLIVKGYLIPS
jgi:polyisoprenoid-binding protein YceI